MLIVWFGGLVGHPAPVTVISVPDRPLCGFNAMLGPAKAGADRAGRSSPAAIAKVNAWRARRPCTAEVYAARLPQPGSSGRLGHP
jgi:hypothetical protein